MRHSERDDDFDGKRNRAHLFTRGGRRRVAEIAFHAIANLATEGALIEISRRPDKRVVPFNNDHTELEDNFADIIGKAQRGLGISDSELAEKSGVSREEIHEVRDGKIDSQTIGRIAPVLKLSAKALVDLAQGKWKPD